MQDMWVEHAITEVRVILTSSGHAHLLDEAGALIVDYTRQEARFTEKHRGIELQLAKTLQLAQTTVPAFLYERVRYFYRAAMDSQALLRLSQISESAKALVHSDDSKTGKGYTERYKDEGYLALQDLEMHCYSIRDFSRGLIPLADTVAAGLEPESVFWQAMGERIAALMLQYAALLDPRVRVLTILLDGSNQTALFTGVDIDKALAFLREMIELEWDEGNEISGFHVGLDKMLQADLDKSNEREWDGF